jgi:hypothetical protein
MDSADDIAKSLKSMTKLGQETIGTDSTTHYVVTMDTTKASGLLGSSGAGSSATPALPKTIDVGMWVDDNSLLRRVVISFGSTAMQLDYTDWGQPVDIKAPKASDLVKAPAGL